MKKTLSMILAAMLAAGTMVLPTAAADGDIVYLQTFDDVASYDDLGWEIVETLTTNTTTYTVENGALTVDNLGGNDSYTVVVPASVMDDVNTGDYTVGYDFTLLEAGDTARYLAMLLNYDRELSNTYNSLHMRMKGYADWQNRFVGTWSTNLDLNGGYQDLPVFTAKDDGAISNRLFGLAYNDAEMVIAGQPIRYEMRVSNSGQYCEIYMNGQLISGTDEAGWDQFTWASEDYSEIALKSGGSILGTVDNIVVVKGLGIPEGTLPELGAAATTAAATTTETAAAAAEEGPALQNLCLGATVEVSGLENDTMLGEYAVDGDLATRWASDYVDDAYITVDLGAPVPVGYVAITWETACAQDYTVETSSDGTSWTTVATVTGNTAGTSPASDAGVVVHEWEPATARYIKINCTKRNTTYGNSIWELVARKSADTAAASELPAAYPSSGTEVPADSVLINGERIGLEEGWGGNAAAGRDAAFDGDVNTYFDPLGTGDGWCGIDAGEEMILTKILIHPRDAQLPRFNGATIEGANEEDFSDAVMLYMSVEEASEFAWIDVSDEIEEADNTGYRYFRYINYTNHGDVGDIELYGKAADGSNPTYGAEAPAEAPAAAESASETVVIYGYDYNDCGENVNSVLQTAEDGSETSIALKPLDAATAATCWWDFELDIPADGTVKFVVTYAANGDRYMDVTFNGITQKVTCPDTGGFDFFETLELEYDNVKAGKQTLRFAAPSDFNNSDIKTPNIDYFAMTVVSAVEEPAPVVEETPAVEEPAAEETPAEEAPAEEETVEAPAEEAAETVEEAPQTFDFGVVAAIAAIASLAGFAVSKKR